MRRAGLGSLSSFRLIRDVSERSDIVFLSGVRTGFGSFGGTLKEFTATDLGALAARAAIERAGIAPDVVDHVIFGNAMQTSADGAYLARHVGIRAGCPIATPAVTVNRLCGSGFEAIVQAAHRILLGEARLVLAHLLKNFTFTPLNAEEIHPHMGATLEPRPGVRMRVKRRDKRVESRE